MKTLISFSVFVMALALGSVVWAAEVEYLCYNNFIKAVEAGQIKSVKLNKYSRITGTYVVNGKEKAFDSYANTGTANDPLLLRFLNEKSVVITVNNEQYERNPWLGHGSVAIFMFLIPPVTLLFVVLIYWRIRRIQPQKSNLSFDNQKAI